MNRKKFINTCGAAAALTALSPVISFSRSPFDLPEETKNSFLNRIQPITSEERLQRMKHAQSLMQENNIDALFLEGGTSLNYFTGVDWWRSERLFAMILPLKGEPYFIAPEFEASRAREQTGNAQLLTWKENENPYEVIRQLLDRNNLLNATMSVEESTRYFVVANLQKQIPSLELQNATVITAGCRSLKTAHEVELMQIANDITAEVFQSSVKQLKTGMTEKEFGKIISGQFSALGFQGGALVLFGEASAHPHGLVKENRLKENDIVLMDGGCSVEGYESDITRTTVFGKPTEKMNTVWSIVSQAQNEALKFAKPGVDAELVDEAARKVITDKGYGPGYKYFTHRLGHGIGMDGHEWYYLVGGNKRLLQTGNMFSNEPGIYIPGEFGIRLEDEMLITEKGARLLLPQAQSLEKMF